MRDVEEVWDIIEKYKKDSAKNSNNNEKIKEENQNGNSDIEEKNCKNKENETNKRKSTNEAEESPKKKKHKKGKQTEEAVEDENNQKNKKDKNNKEDSLNTQIKEVVEETTKFNFQEKISEIVTAKGPMSLKKLQKKILNAYVKGTGETEITPKLIKKFNKKLKKIPNLEITGDQVTILETNS